MRTSIRTTVVTVFVVATALTAALAIGLQYYFGQSIAKQSAEDLYTLTASSIAAKLHSIGQVNNNVIDLLADNPSLPYSDRRDDHLESFIRVLEKNPLYYGIYLGRSDGSFFKVINLDAHKQARTKLRALPADRWLVETLSDGASGQERRYQYLDKNLKPRLSRSEPANHEVNTHPWYADATASNTIQRSDPYLFAELGVPGRTLSKRVTGTDTVVAIDITLSSISEFMEEHGLSEHGDVYVYDTNGQVIASSLDNLNADPELPLPPLVLDPAEKQYIESLPVLKVSNEPNWPPFDYTQTGEPRGYSIDIIRMIARMTGLQVQFVNGYDWPELVSQFKSGELDLLHAVILTRDNESWGLPGDDYASLPYALVTREDRLPLRGIAELSGGSLAIPAGWSIIPVIRERFPDLTIMEVESTLAALEHVLSGDADAALDNEIIMRYVARHYYLEGLQYHSDVSLGDGAVPDKLHIMVQNDQPRLRAIIDKAIAAIGPEQREYLSAAWLGFGSDAEVRTSATVPGEMLVKIAEDPDLHAQLLETKIGDKPYLVYAAPLGEADSDTPNVSAPVFVGILAPLDSVLEPFISKANLSIAITGAFLILLLPLSWVFASPIVRPIRQLATENDKVRMREYDKVVRVDSRVKEVDELSESMVNMVAAIQAHELAQRRLMDSFIQLIAQAIDDKSAYTGGHCERVPELALMLAEHASASDRPRFGFRLETEDEWREYRIAAWLHDCGKITTPEHIVDKGSKLETIYNRIHEVRMRFEVLWRDAEIAYHKQLAEPPQADQTLPWRCCSGAGSSVTSTNSSRPAMSVANSWNRNNWTVYERSPGPPGSVTSTTVSACRRWKSCGATRRVHPAGRRASAGRQARAHHRAYPPDGLPPEFGIDMEIPEHLYNLGEVYNLSVSRGTLTEEDRFKINEHVISTIKMLESLPFPEELKNVPRYASTHHETMKGWGYPRRLSGAQLSIPERIRRSPMSLKHSPRQTDRTRKQNR